MYSPELGSSWVIGRDTEESYLSNLFSVERMEKRKRFFESITLKSLVGLHEKKSQDIEFKVLILTSDKIPRPYMEFLAGVEKKFCFIEVIPLSPKDSEVNAGLVQYIADIAEGDIYASVRLDDDDGLANTFIDQLENYMKPEFSGFVVSFAKGHGVLLDNAGDIKKMANYKWRFGSAGLSYISTKNNALETGRYSAYQCGNHIKTDDLYPTISDGRHAAFIRAFHAENDSKDKFDDCVARVLTDEERNNKMKVYSLK